MAQWSRLRTERAVRTPIWSDSKRNTVVSGHHRIYKKRKKTVFYDFAEKIRRLILQKVNLKSIRLQQTDVVGAAGARIILVEA